LQIQFRENGRGFDPDSRPGRGIGNVRKRIQDLQGEITFKQQADGFETSIVIPGFSLN
jgi:signal transduction histidine kinase